MTMGWIKEKKKKLCHSHVHYMVGAAPVTFACTLRHLVVGPDLFLGSGATARRKWGEKPHKSAFVSGEPRSMPRPTICLITAANQQVNATQGRQALVGRDQTVDLGDDRCRWEKKAIKHCFKDGNGALGGKLLLTVICRIAPRILIDWLLWSLWSRGNARLLFMVGYNQKIAAVFGATIAAS